MKADFAWYVLATSRRAGIPQAHGFHALAGHIRKNVIKDDGYLGLISGQVIP